MCDCSICFNPLFQDKGNFLRLKCKHEFHFNCIFKLTQTEKEYSNKCPICRIQLFEKRNEQISKEVFLNICRKYEELEGYTRILILVIFLLFFLICLMTYKLSSLNESSSYLQRIRLDSIVKESKCKSIFL